MRTVYSLSLLIIALSLSLTAIAKTPLSDDEIDKKVNELVKKLSLEEKVGQMMQINVDLIMKGKVWALTEPNEVDLSKVDTIIGLLGTGSILNCGGHTWSRETWYSIHEAIQAKAKETTGIPVLYGVDAIHGVNYTQGATLFPQQLGQAATWNPELIKRGAEITAYETRASGIPWNFSPVLDLGRQPLWSRFFETYGEDVYLAKQCGRACVEGYQGEDVADKYRVAACMKHFFGYSNSFTGKDRTPVYMHERQLREYYLPTFQEAIAAGAKTVMINSGEINGIPVHADHDILTVLLREELGFEGLAVTDWEDIIKLVNLHRVAVDEKEATAIAINAGIDMSMVPVTTDFHRHLVELVNEGRVPIERIDEAVSRILKLKFELGLFENPYYPMEDYPKFGSDEFARDALKTAHESITILENNLITDSRVLPMDKEEKVLLTGPAANSMTILNGAWTHTWQGTDEKYNTKGKLTIKQAFAKQLGNKLMFSQGSGLDSAIDLTKTLTMAKEADKIVVCLGELPSTEKPGDINSLRMPDAQLQLVKELAKTDKPVVLVLVENRPLIINEIVDLVDAVIMAYLPGDMGAPALLDILYGKVNPSGKLPFTYPRYENDLVLYDHKTTERLDKDFGMNAFNPQWEFGHGLSYANIQYSDLSVSPSVSIKDQIEVSVRVTNKSNIPAKEAVQIYVRDEVASITPADKRLRAFNKVSLSPSESKLVKFSIHPTELGFVNKDNKWTTESGDFTIFCGQLSEKFTLN